MAKKLTRKECYTKMTEIKLNAQQEELCSTSRWDFSDLEPPAFGQNIKRQRRYSGAVGTCYSLNSNLEHINNKTTIAEFRQEAANLLQKAQKLYGLNREMLEEVLKHEYLINSELI